MMDAEQEETEIENVDTDKLEAALESVKKLEEALEKERTEKKEIKSLNDKDRERLEKYEAAERKREEEEAKKAGRWDELRQKLTQEHEAERTKLQSAVEELTVTNELRRAINDAGFAPEYHEAVEAMFLRRGPKVEWKDDKPVGVFPDELHGAKAISDAVQEFAKSDAAEAFLPPKTGPGGGGDGTRGRKGSSTKPYSEMTLEEKADYFDSKG